MSRSEMRQVLQKHVPTGTGTGKTARITAEALVHLETQLMMSQWTLTYPLCFSANNTGKVWHFAPMKAPPSCHSDNDCK